MVCDCNGSRFEDDFRNFEEREVRGNFCDFDSDDRNDTRDRNGRRDGDDRRDRDDRRRRNCRRLANEVERRIDDLQEDIRRLDNAFDRLEDRGCIRGRSRDDDDCRGRRCRRCDC
ncbi:MAG: hypothetical protein ACLSH8_08810 [Zhenhengia sp.]|jgi:hypothetical protein|uniref:hypothetical protein n=1 Tax=Zhenhengia sp. TaxID=2944208 RepID=UPI0029129683|nr:hypothetical protein [Clostridiales bacterium]MDU6975870.1 hypothetical protein [Clostridiales bacterium]